MKRISEFTLIGSLLVYPEKADLIKPIKPSYFSDSLLSKIFSIIKNDLWASNTVISLESLRVAIDSSKILSYDLEVDEVIKKSIKAAYPINKTFIDKFIREAKLRSSEIKLRKLLEDFTLEDYQHILVNLNEIIEDLQNTGNEKIEEFYSGEFLKKRLQLLKNREEINKVIFGVPPLDRLIPGGLNKKEISVIASRPSIGKSLLKANLIKIQCELGYSVASLATEQTAEIETDRMDSLITKIPLLEIINSREWKNGDPRIKKIIEANQRIDEKWKYFLMVNRNYTIGDLRRWIDKLISKFGDLDILYIDLFDKLRDVNVSKNKPTVISEKLGELNQLAEEFNIHISILVQINRELRHVKGHRPQIWHIKDSGSYEEVARLILLLHREKYYNPQIRENLLEINVAKQSNGPAGSNITAELIINDNDLSLDWSPEANPNIF